MVLTAYIVEGLVNEAGKKQAYLAHARAFTLEETSKVLPFISKTVLVTPPTKLSATVAVQM